MARPAKLKPWLLLAPVLVAHVVGLEWLARARDQLSLLQVMAPPMYTRLLAPQEAPAVVAAAPAPPPKPKARARSSVRAVKPRPKASEPLPQVAQASPQPEATPPVQAEPAPLAPPQEPVAAAPPVDTASAPQAPASAPAAPASASAAPAELAGWPGDTRLSYRLGGIFRGGPLFGDARVQWQRQGNAYQVRLDIDIKYFTTYVMTSQGEVTAAGLLPRAYEEYRPGKRRSVQFGDATVTLDNGKTTPRPPGVQDTVSQFVELAHRFANGQQVLRVGDTVSFPLGRPGGVDLWTYDIVEKETLRTPKLGAVEAFHLKPRPIPNARGNISADMWFAPSLQYLPVRIKVSMGDADYLDLLVDHIDQ